MLLISFYIIENIYILLVKNISDGGKTIPSMLILFGIFILKKWTEENNFNKDILLAITGYSNDELVL